MKQSQNLSHLSTEDMRSLLFILLFFSFGLNAQLDEVKRITKELCSPEFHGRGYVNKGDSIAAGYLASEFQKVGAQPFCDDYLQHFKMDVNTFPGEMMVQQKGVKLVPGVDFSINPNSKGISTTLYPIEIPEEKALDIEYLKKAIGKAKSSFKQHALVFSYANVSTDTMHKIKGLIYEIATILPVIELVDTKFTWSVGQSQNLFPYIQIQEEAYKKGQPLDVSIEARLLEDYQTQNVIAFLPSKNKKAPFLVFTAHYDHLGRMGEDTYFPGGNDNASGTAMLITMAKYFKENPSDYNIIFIAFGGEEVGLLGSKYFVEHPVLKLKKIKFLINLDIMGSGEESITAVNATLFPDEFQLLQDINKEKNLIKEIKSRGPAANSDHYWFTEKGVPAFFIYTTGPNKHYHDVFDTYEELTFSEYDDVTTLLIEFVKRL